MSGDYKHHPVTVIICSEFYQRPSCRWNIPQMNFWYFGEPALQFSLYSYTAILHKLLIIIKHFFEAFTLCEIFTPHSFDNGSLEAELVCCAPCEHVSLTPFVNQQALTDTQAAQPI